MARGQGEATSILYGDIGERSRSLIDLEVPEKYLVEVKGEGIVEVELSARSLLTDTGWFEQPGQWYGTEFWAVRGHKLPERLKPTDPGSKLASLPEIADSFAFFEDIDTGHTEVPDFQAQNLSSTKERGGVLTITGFEEGINQYMLASVFGAAEALTVEDGVWIHSEQATAKGLLDMAYVSADRSQVYAVALSSALDEVSHW